MSSPANTAAKQLSHQPLSDGLYFGESPRYRDGTLYVSDMTGRKVYTINVSSGQKDLLLDVENQPNGMCFASDGALIYSSMFDAKLYRLQNGQSKLYADMSHVMTGYCGDMVIDRTGRIYIDDTGARVLHNEKPRPGRLLVVETDGTVKVAAESIVFPNGLVIDNEGKTVYCGETFGYGLLKFDIGPDGELDNRQQVWAPATFAKDIGASADGINAIDGACMDAEGYIWLSLMAMEEFVRLHPTTGHMTHRIKVDGHATACTLGGEDGKMLFLCTNKVPDGETLFPAMVAKRTRCTVSVAKVEVGRGQALP